MRMKINTQYTWLTELSPGNLERVQKVLKILMDEVEIRAVNRLTFNKIPLNGFRKEGFEYEDIVAVLRKVDPEGRVARTEKITMPLFEGNDSWLTQAYSISSIKHYGVHVSKEESDNIFLLEIKDFEELKHMEEAVRKSRVQVLDGNKQPQSPSKEDTLICAGLAADFSKGTVQYDKHKAKEISAETKPMRMLKLLLEKQPNTVTYLELGAEFDLSAPETGTKKVGEREIKVLPHQSHGRVIQTILRDLKNILRDAGMDDRDIENMIVTKPKQGYALRCGNQKVDRKNTT